MNEEALFQEYSTNRALQATYPDFATYRDFVMSQMPAAANESSGLSSILNNAASSVGTIKDLGKNLIMGKLTSKMGMGLNPIGIGGLVLQGLSGVNDKIQSTDFAQAKNLAENMEDYKEDLMQLLEIWHKQEVYKNKWHKEHQQM